MDGRTVPTGRTKCQAIVLSAFAQKTISSVPTDGASRKRADAMVKHNRFELERISQKMQLYQYITEDLWIF
jgi:hypothetical protein